MDQHDAELTSKVRRMVNDAKTYIPAPFITLEDNTTLHDYAEEENPSLHGSRNEGFSYKASENDEDDSENECKYDVPDDSEHRYSSEIPLDAEERRVKRREVINPDREVMMGFPLLHNHAGSYCLPT